MLINLNQDDVDQKNSKLYDVAIIGAGAAGITLALHLALNKQSVALIEGGNYDYTDESQEIYKAKSIGDPYYDLDATRLRYFGGSTNHWGGYCRTFESIDFNRGYLGEKFEWPIDFYEIDKYRKQACEILEIPATFKDITVANSNIKQIDIHESPPVRFREKYFERLINNQFIDVYINSNLTDVKSENRKINEIKLISYTFKNLNVKAKNFVFAMGGIENSRYLLWLQQVYKDKLFSISPSLGKYWMEHPHYKLGQALIDKSKVSGYYYALSGNAQKKQNILNCGFRVHHYDEKITKKLIRQVLCLAPSLGKKLINLAKKDLVCGAILRASWEQAPDFSNMITLDTEKDKFGIPKPILNWKKRPFDRVTITKSVAEFNKWLVETDRGRVQIIDWITQELDYPNDDPPFGGHHHMGGTRMHNNIKFGVVDSNCRVHGSKNLYIAGSSVFTTGGHNNPTLPIVQLALRLGDHLIT